MAVANSPQTFADSDEPTFRELASGIDALYMSGRAELTDRLLENLKLTREVAEQADESIEFVLGGEQFEMRPFSLGRYRYRLEHAYGVIGITPGHALPTVRIQPRAEYLHRIGPREVVGRYHSILERELGELVLHASRIDLFVDIQGWDLEADDRHDFVRRARDIGTRESGIEFNGLQFGSRKSKTIYCRIYNKTAEIRKTGEHYVEQMWGERFNPEAPVIRTEFEIGRKALRQYGIDSVEQAIESARELWKSLTSDSLTYRLDTADRNRSRRPIAPVRIVVQNAEFSSGAIGLERMKEDQANVDISRIAQFLTGYVTSVAAIKGVRSLEDAWPAVKEVLKMHERTSGRNI